MGTVHAKADENLTDTPNSNLKSKAMFREPPDKEHIKEIDLEGVKARVDKIHVDGLSRTKNDIIEDCIKELFKAKDFQDVLLKAHKARVKLDELGCFKNISVYIDTSKGSKATPDGLEVTFNVKEHKRITGGVSTHVGNNEGVLQIGMRAPNIFGRGERVQVEYSHGSKKSSNFNLAFIKPFRGKYRPTLTTSVFQSHSEWPASGYKQLERGLIFDLGFYSWSLLKHNLQWEGNIRDLSVLTRNASFDVRKESGLSLKSSLRHILSLDLRDDLIFPSSGSLLQLTSEVAGLGGDVGFLKNDIFVQGNYSIAEDIVFQACFSTGYMTSISNDLKISLSDMYFLGGPLSLRGFQNRGVGPHSDGDALGSKAYWAGGLHLFTPLPFRPGRGGFGELFRTHFFMNAGNIGNVEVLKDGNLLDLIQNNLRVSYGLGVALRLGNMARLEINYCFPYIYDKGDQTHPGVQFGIGVQFL
ncbi:sorting and assembly machinery component 50 homolog isoform X2 [Diabrotica undecimpunctata]|uniref:sorting and assembly machinery component 50 homolog isoform X2 n=1 Tax=Diabrotica undecimpunctata TaxID=50387 RepID=UPI003B63EE67